MPEGYAIGRVHSRHAVIAPTISGLGADAVFHDGFTLAEIIWRIGLKTPGITNAGENGRTGCSIADGHVSILING